MHGAGGYVDVSTLLPYFITALVLCIGIANLFKLTASKYLYPLGYEAEEHGTALTKKPLQMDSSMHACAVCQEPGSKRCSRCKTVHYCSLECQTKHWNQGHKLDCRATTDPAGRDRKSNACNSSNASGTCKNTGVPLTASSGGSDAILPNAKKVLFPYETFMELFKWNKLRLPPRGLLNCGNSCFANVVLQCLTYTRPLVAYLLESNHTHTCVRNDWCFLCELIHHVRRVSQSEEPFSPLRILSHIPKMSGSLGSGRQEDAHEFMRVAIDSMQSICLDEVGGEKAVDLDTRETTLIYHIFGGHLQSQVKCTQCERVSNRYENMMDLNVEIHGDVASLEDALEQFTTSEWLDGENKYRCDGCNAYVKALKRLTVHQAPNILTIALKRFQTGRFGKLNKRVTFPETLDLSPYMSGEANGLHIYKLYAVVVHVDMLNASFFGHYVCYVKDLHGLWYRIDDCKVKRVELEDALSERAYMLLYSRLSVRYPPNVADSPPTSAVIKVARCDFNHSTSLVHNQSHFTSCRTDGYLPSPFEVVEPLRSNLGNAQEATNENIEVPDSLTSSDDGRNMQKSDLATGSLRSCDVDMVPVEMTSEALGLVTSNSSCSEESSTKARESGLITLHPSLSESKPLNTCLNRSTSCPSLLAVKQSLPVGNINEGAISFDPLAGLVFLPKHRLDNGEYSSSVSKHSHLDTPRTSGLTECDRSRISTVQNCDLDVLGPEKMDCGYEITQPSAENSSDNFLGFLNEYAVNRTVDNSSQQIPATMNITPFYCDNGEASLNSSLHAYLPTVTYENQHGIVLNYRDLCGQAGNTGNISEADMMEKEKDAGDEPHKQEGSSSRKTIRNASQHGMPCVAAQSSEAEPRIFCKDEDFVDSQFNLTFTTDNDVMSCESTRDADGFPTEDGMVEGVADSTSELISCAHQHPEEHSDTCQHYRNGCLENVEGAMLEGSASTQFSVSPLDSAKIFTTSSDRELISTQTKKAVKSKSTFTPGFLNGPSSLYPVTHSILSQDDKNHSFTSSGDCSLRKYSYLHDDGAKSVTSTSVQFDVESRTHLAVSSNGNSSTPVDGSKVVTSVFSEFDMEPRAETIASLSCEAAKRQTRNTIKTKPLFTPGFLNSTTRLQDVTQFKARQKNDCSANGLAAVCKTAVGDEISGAGQVDAYGYKPILGQSGMPVVQNQNAEKNGLGSSPCIEKEATCNGRKRALSSESLHTDQGSSLTLNANGKMAVTLQKQGRNESCSCGSQRKWKKCCGRPDVLRNLSAR